VLQHPFFGPFDLVRSMCFGPSDIFSVCLVCPCWICDADMWGPVVGAALFNFLGVALIYSLPFPLSPFCFVFFLAIWLSPPLATPRVWRGMLIVLHFLKFLSSDFDICCLSFICAARRSSLFTLFFAILSDRARVRCADGQRPAACCTTVSRSVRQAMRHSVWCAVRMAHDGRSGRRLAAAGDQVPGSSVRLGPLWSLCMARSAALVTVTRRVGGGRE
jgi:hypothetical protein